MSASPEATNLSQQFAALGDKLSASARAMPVEKIRLGLLILLLLGLLYTVVMFLWLFLPEPADVNTLPSDVVLGGNTPGSAGSKTVDIDSKLVSGWSLFGGEAVTPAAPVPQLTGAELSDDENNAEETTLQLTLQGIIEAGEEEYSRAIIAYQNKQEQYAIGDKLPINQVTVKRLLDDRVLLNNRGKVEALYLFDKRRQAQPAKGQRRPPSRPAKAQASRDRGTDFRNRLLSNPTSLTQIVRISEAREGGKVIGYKVRPSKDRARFEALGFQAGDIVTSINGINMDNPTSALQVFQMLRTAEEAAFEISRAGEQISMAVSLDDAEEQLSGALDDEG